jgi:hypothetical protein
MNWIVTAGAWIVAIYMVTRSSVKTRILGIAIAILAGVLLGISEYNRGRVHGRIEHGVRIGSEVLTNLGFAVQMALEDIIRSNRLNTGNVSDEHKTMFSNTLEILSKEEKTDANTASHGTALPRRP